MKRYEVPQNQYGHKTLNVNDKLAVQNHEYIFDALTKVHPTIAREMILEFIDDYSMIKKESLKESGHRGRSFPFDIANALESLKLMAETLKEITVTKDEDGFVFDNYKPFLLVVSDNGFCSNISNELNMIILDYATFKVRELSIEPNQNRAKSAFQLLIFMQVFTDGVNEIKYVPIFEATSH